MRKWIILCLFIATRAAGQELYVFSEPASNMPARSLGIKQTAKLFKGSMSNRTEGRYNTELMLGLSKKWMLHFAGTFSDMYTNNLRFESVRAYTQYRFLSRDDMYSHFRMAAFAEASYSRNKPMYDELALEGDQSGVLVGLTATQLMHKLAVSGSVSYLEALQSNRWDKPRVPVVPYQAVSYSLSAGYLVFPRKYQSYGQTNLNLYLSLLGQRATDMNKHYVDLAPAAQLIFNSEAKLNLGYRFELNSNMHRMSDRSWLIGFEWLFLNVLKKM